MDLNIINRRPLLHILLPLRRIIITELDPEERLVSPPPRIPIAHFVECEA